MQAWHEKEFIEFCIYSVYSAAGIRVILPDMKAILFDLFAAITIILIMFAIFALLAVYAPVNETPYFHGGKWQASPASKNQNQ